MPHLQLASPSSGMQYGGSTDVEVYGHAGAPLLKQLAQHVHAPASRRGVYDRAHHLQPEHGAAPGATFPFLAISRAPRRHGVVEQQSEHVGAASHSGRVEHVRDAVLTLAEDKQWVPLQ